MQLQGALRENLAQESPTSIWDAHHADAPGMRESHHTGAVCRYGISMCRERPFLRSLRLLGYKDLVRSSNLKEKVARF